MENLPCIKLVPGAKKVGDHWFMGITSASSDAFLSFLVTISLFSMSIRLSLF